MEDRRIMLARRYFCWIAFLIFGLVLESHANGTNESHTDPGWITRDLSFRVLNVASGGSRIWACGTDEGIAASSDGGEHWQIKHQASGGNLLLSVQFVGEKFGFAAGTGGTLLTSEDGGETWTTRPSPGATILQISLSDANHGIVRTPDSLLVTSDGGAHWSPVSFGENADTLKQFPYTFALAALDSSHWAVMLKRGSAQYESQAFLVSSDGGATWKTEHVPNSTLYSFLTRGGEYWAIGTEVIHKDQPGGGYAVPVAWHSPDGDQWTRSSAELSACKLEMCVACKHEGCLSSNGTISEIFSEKPSYLSFPANAKLNSKWAATENAICFCWRQLAMHHDVEGKSILDRRRFDRSCGISGTTWHQNCIWPALRLLRNGSLSRGSEGARLLLY
jgi:Photosynthesis system II assembly factor YCF48